MLTLELEHFGKQLAALDYGEVDLAVSLIWYRCQVEGETEVSAASIAKLMHDLSLRGQVNVSRLAARLGQCQDLLRGRTPSHFKVRAQALDRLTQAHEHLLEHPKPKVAPHVVPMDEFVGTTRKYLLSLIEQINGSYQFGFFDSCAAMSRRLMETLLIEAFEHAGKGDKIKTGDGQYVGLADIISRARSNQHIRLQRGSADTMEEIKVLGDTAAHSRMYITKQSDLDHVRFKYRKVIAELAHLAGIS
jgi:hypothetical protein